MNQIGPPLGTTFFGHPRGLATLFFTEMWERFSYYGMRGLLILFLTATTISENPGMGLDAASAAAIYGLYTALVYLLALPGGWVADNIWGQRKAIFIGGCIIAAGHFSMALPSDATFFAGLILIVVGTGLLKPNVSTVVGDLYPEGGARRDAGFSIYYMGINLGGFLGPLLVGYFGEGMNWHYGFGLAGIGMIAGLIQFRMGYKHLGNIGILPVYDGLAAKERRFYLYTGITGAIIAAFALLVSSGVIDVSLSQIAATLGGSILVVVAAFFLYLIIFSKHTALEKKRFGIIFWLFLLVSVFWAGFEQAGSSLNLFAESGTDRVMFGWEMPASWFQSVNSLFIIIMAPVFGSLWVFLARINRNPSFLYKFALGLFGLAGGFFVLAWGASFADQGDLVSPAWLTVTYFFFTCGELCISPVGMSSVTKLAPANRVGQMMGVWFVGTALGNLIAGLAASDVGSGFQPLFWQVTTFAAGAAIIALLAAPFLKKFTGDVQ
ncbi:MAG: peptide MFS transporter [Bacteroidetes bacterium]|nr:peptide MFS transporter [Bacteroidota bacterium]